MDPRLSNELRRLLPREEFDAILRRLEQLDDVEPPRAAATSAEPDEIVPNRGHYFEVLDRVHVVSCHLEEHIGTHPVIQRHSELTAICDRAAEALAELYQAVGRLPAFDEPW